MSEKQGVGPGTAISNRSEANTVLFPASAPTVATDTKVNARQATVQTGETTVVRQPRKIRRKTWVIAVAEILLLVAGVGGFYAYQKSNNSANVEGPAIHQISTPAVQSAPTGGGSAASTEASEETKQTKV
ncbi:MAG: hypothetical protein M3410_06130 [Acidobacteriota bacterium]|nr:hypothetical protein [Acidobacteriota bacterium]